MHSCWTWTIFIEHQHQTRPLYDHDGLIQKQDLSITKSEHRQNMDTIQAIECTHPPSLANGCCCCCSVSQSCPTLCDPMDCSTPGFPVHHQLLEPAHPLPIHPLPNLSFLFFKDWFIINWRIMALQNCVGFCQTSTWISHSYTYLPHLFFWILFF